MEIEHLKTQIIALHEEYKVVDDTWKDVKVLRDREENHQAGAEDLQNYIDGKLKQMDIEENENNLKYEQMLVDENDELMREIQKLQQEIDSVNTETQAQKVAYEKQIQTKQSIINRTSTNLPIFRVLGE